MEENQNKINIDLNNKKENVDVDDITLKIKEFYKDQEIAQFFESTILNKGKKIIEELNHYYENNDWRNCIIIIKKIILNKLFVHFNKQLKVELLDLITKKIIPNIYFYSMPDINIIMELLGSFYNSIPKDYVFDWKQFYTLFYTIDLFENVKEQKNYLKFYTKLHKFIPENAITFEDYQIMRRTVLDDLVKAKQIYAMCVFIYFLPKKFLFEDDEIQLRLFYMLKNWKSNFVPCCQLFTHLLNHNGKLYFSKDPKENKEYIKQFIQYYFTHLNLYILVNSKVTNNNAINPKYNEKQKILKNRSKFNSSIVEILINLLFNENFKEFTSFVEDNLKIILNNKHLYLKEKSTDSVTRNYISFLQVFIYEIFFEFHTKSFDKDIGKAVYIVKTYEDNKYKYDRLLTVLKYFSLNFEKLFLFDNEGACLSQRTLFSLLSSENINDEYIKQVILNINLEHYIKMLNFFKANSETRMGKFIMKLYSIMPLLLNEYVFCNFPNVRELVKESIGFLADNVSSAHSRVDIDILLIFCYEFFRVRELSKKNKIYEFLIPLISEATIKIMNNLLRILDLICKNNNLDYNIFIMSMKKFLDKETLKKISLTYVNFIENNEILSSNLDFYFCILNEEEEINIFNYIYNNLLYIDSSNNVEINKHFLYPKIDKDFNINVNNCSVEIFIEKQLQGFISIFSYLDYSKILTNDTMIKKFYEIYYALVNQKDKKFKKLGNEFFGFVINSLLECKIREKDTNDGKKISLIEYPSEKEINIVLQMYEKLILPYEQFVIEYMEKNTNNNKDNYKDIDKQTLEQILGIYMKLIHKISIAKTNLILNANFDEEEKCEEYKYIKNQIKLYKKYKNYVYNSFNVIKKIFDYNKNDIDNKLFNNHLTNLYLDEILALKLKTSSQRINSRNVWYKNLNKIIYFNKFSDKFKDFYLVNLTNLTSIIHFKVIKYLTPKDNLYYTFLDLYLQSFNSVNHPSIFITVCSWDFYSLDPEKIKTLFNQTYTIFVEKLEKLKTDSLIDSLTEQNIMKNISETFHEFCILYITLFPYDSLNVIEKLFRIIMLLKIQKYRRLDLFISGILNQMKVILQTSKNIDIQKDKRFKRYSKKNIIIEEEMNKIYKIVSDNYKNQNYLFQHNNNIKTFIEKSLAIIFPSEIDNDNNDNKKYNINKIEEFLFFSLLVDYIKISLDKQDDLYRKVIQIIFNNLILQKVPVSIRILWLQKLYFLVQKEYHYYQDYEWIIFKSKEEYLELWNKLKYTKSGKESMIGFPLERIRLNKFKFDEYLNNNLKYEFNIEKFLYCMAEVDEYEEDQKLVKNAPKKLNSLDEVVSKLVISRFNEKKGLDFKKAKMFYYMFKLKYIDYDCDFVKNFNFSSLILGKKIKHNCVVYEFLLGKYEYMFDNNLFTEKDRNDLWEIMNKFTRRVDKISDERIYAFFNYLFNNYALGDLEYIFKYDFYKYPLDFVADMYFLYHQDLPNLRSETKMFDNSKTEELLTKIYSSDENIILDLNYLVYVLKMYYTTNGILKYSYYYFTSEFTDEMYNHYMGILKKANTKHGRYALFTIYHFFFDYLNKNLNLLKETIQKMGLCINEFNSTDKTTMSDKSKKIIQNIESSFLSFTGNIHFPSLCDAIVDILHQENDNNDTNKLIYLQVVNNVYKGQKHLNIYKYSNQEIFDSLFKVFSAIKNEKIKKNFSSIFLTFFNDMTEEDNIKFIERYEKYIYENTKEVTEDKNQYNYIYILMNQLLRFKIRIPEYMQKFIIKLKIVNKIENDKIKKIIIDSLKTAMNYYHGSYIFMKENISEECKEVLEELTREKTYFV